MQRVKIQYRCRADLRTTHDEALQRLPGDRHVSQHFGADCYCPVRNLVPWQQVAGETRYQDQNHHPETDQPIGSPHTLKRPGEEHAEQV